MIREYATEQKGQLIDDAVRQFENTGDGVFIAADAQYNSPGFCAALGTVGLMNADTGMRCDAFLQIIGSKLQKRY